GRGIGAVGAGIRAHGHLHGEGVLAEAIGAGELGENRPRGVPTQARAGLWRAFHLSMDFLGKSHLPSGCRHGIRRSPAIRVTVCSSMARYSEASSRLIASFGTTPSPLFI